MYNVNFIFFFLYQKIKQTFLIYTMKYKLLTALPNITWHPVNDKPDQNLYRTNGVFKCSVEKLLNIIFGSSKGFSVNY